MQPIVNGIQDEYSDSVAFISFNAKDSGDGQAIFQNLGLPGHPSIVIYSKTGEEIYRQFGIVGFDDLDTVLINNIESEAK